METGVMSKETKIQNWFDDLVATLRKDQLMIETGVASKDLEKMYQILFNEDYDKLHENLRVQNTHYFIKKLVIDYLTEVRRRGNNPEKLALQLSESKILVWAEIKDDDESTEDSLLLAEAMVNAKYNELGFHLSSTILESSDNYPIPEQFSSVI
nr:hypothetical protein [uncultured Draconibacterium sp.]